MPNSRGVQVNRGKAGVKQALDAADAQLELGLLLAV